jgi:hypothetical protein
LSVEPLGSGAGAKSLGRVSGAERLGKRRLAGDGPKLLREGAAVVELLASPDDELRKGHFRVSVCYSFVSHRQLETPEN